MARRNYCMIDSRFVINSGFEFAYYKRKRKEVKHG
jgi:hypothetical protein